MPKCYWNALWLEHEDFKSWITQDPKDECAAHCKLCKKSFSLSSMGTQALRNHARGKLHQDLVTRPKSSGSIATLFGMPPKRSEAANGHAATTTQPSVDKYLDGKETLRREIIWTLKVIKSHYSYHSCEDFIQTLKMMFPNNPDISKMTLGETKCHYLSVFGIAPHFERLLREAVRKGKTYVLLFDETFNAELQKKQLDIHVRFWDGRKISTRYLTSVFMGHATAADLLDRILPVCQELCPDGLLQLSMDGPHVNWSLYKKLAEALSKHGNGPTRL